MSQQAPPSLRPPSPLVGLALNVVVPVIILNKLAKWLPGISPWSVLIIALCFPIAGALLDFRTKKKLGALPALGLLNVMGTGGLAALGLGGIWFAIKEAFFPALIGIVVLISAFGRRPLAEAIFLNDAFVRTDVIDEKINASSGREIFVRHLKTATLVLAGSFFLSAVLNFALARYVFTTLPQTLSPEAQAQALNEQVARMTWMSFIVILLPSFACTAAAFMMLIRDVKRLTGLTDEEIYKS